MHIYSHNIIKFVHEIKTLAKQILTKEVGLKVSGQRFYDKFERTSYPLKIVIFNNKNKLGYFESDFFEMGFHEKLMHSNKEILKNIIRHEIAHYLTFINFGPHTESHGAEFKQVCKNLSWGEEVSSATVALDDLFNPSEKTDDTILRKIQKLMSLAGSSNKHEAELAMIKSQQLLLKHNIDARQTSNLDDEKTYLKRIMKQTKENAKMRSIASILETFFVSTVYSRSQGFIYLEILGSAVNVEIAEYVSDVLNHELDRLWNMAKKEHLLKGQIAKNSFFLGVAKGYCNKVCALKRDYAKDVANELMIIDKKLSDARSMAYNRLSSTRSSGSHCQESSSIGEKMGIKLNINSAINSPAKQSSLLLSLFK